MPIDTTLPEERIKHILMDAQTRVLISGKKYIRTLQRLQWECPLLKYFISMDTYDIHGQEEIQKSELMDKKLWEYVGETAVDDISAGGWKTSYTGEPFTRAEMDEYADNALEKLNPLLNKNTRVLEIGCASGITMYRLAPKVGFYYGTDLSRVIIRKNKERVCSEGRQNIKLAVIPAHEIHHIDEKNFDIIIMNSVVQNFHGHNYLRKVIHQCIGLLRKKGMLFIGDIMDQDLKENLVREMKNFKQANRNKTYQTTTDFSAALFLSRAYFQDLAADIASIQRIDFSRKIYTVENELTKFRYDACIYIDKSAARTGSDKRSIPRKQKHRCQHDLRDLAKYSREKVRAPILTPGHLAYVIYTSGSTGKPKGVMVEHRNVAHLVSGLQQRIYYYCSENHPHLQVCLVSPYMFDASVKQIFGALLQGHTLHIVDEKTRGSGEELLAFYQGNGIQVSDGTPAHLQLLLEGTEAYPAPLELENFLVGGEVLPQPLARDFLNRFSSPGTPGKFLTVTNVYGPTECTVDATFYQLTTGNIPPMQTIPIGIPLPNVRVYITGLGNRKELLQPLGVPGELCIAGGGVARGYLNQPGLTAEKFCLRQARCFTGRFLKKLPREASGTRETSAKNFLLKGTRGLAPLLYRSGDLARWLQDGNLEFLGRIDLQVKIRGFRIELEEIETLLLQHNEIKEAAVANRTREKTGDTFICAYVVPASRESKTLSDEELKSYLSLYLPGYMIPGYFVRMEKMPLTSSGKVDRKALPIPEPLQVKSESYTAPGNPIEEALVQVWSEVLGIEKDIIGIDDDFFELGGHSLKATIMASKIHKKLNVKVPLAQVFQTPTIRVIASLIEVAQWVMDNEGKRMNAQEREEIAV